MFSIMSRVQGSGGGDFVGMLFGICRNVRRLRFPAEV